MLGDSLSALGLYTDLSGIYAAHLTSDEAYRLGAELCDRGMDDPSYEVHIWPYPSGDYWFFKIIPINQVGVQTVPSLDWQGQRHDVTIEPISVTGVEQGFIVKCSANDLNRTCRDRLYAREVAFGHVMELYHRILDERAIDITDHLVDKEPSS